jgi:hypothetical protein
MRAMAVENVLHGVGRPGFCSAGSKAILVEKEMDGMKYALLIAAAIAAVGMSGAGARAATVVVNGFAANTSTAGVWGASDMRTGGVDTVVAAAPAGDPLGPGAAMISTINDNASKAEVAIANNYGHGSVLSNINLAYSYYKQNGGAAGAPAIKLTFFDPTYAGDGYVTLVYEPYFNMAGNPADNTWYTANIDATHGLFWENGGFGQPNQAGGGYSTNKTLAGWLTAFNSTSGGAFGSNATLVGVSVGVGTYNPATTSYFDAVSINGTAQANTTYNFEAVPLPSAAGMGAWILALGGAAAVIRKKLRTA